MTGTRSSTSLTPQTRLDGHAGIQHLIADPLATCQPPLFVMGCLLKGSRRAVLLPCRVANWRCRRMHACCSTPRAASSRCWSIICMLRRSCGASPHEAWQSAPDARACRRCSPCTMAGCSGSSEAPTLRASTAAPGTASSRSCTAAATTITSWSGPRFRQSSQRRCRCHHQTIASRMRMRGARESCESSACVPASSAIISGMSPVLNARMPVHTRQTVAETVT